MRACQHAFILVLQNIQRGKRFAFLLLVGGMLLLSILGPPFFWIGGWHLIVASEASVLRVCIYEQYSYVSSSWNFRLFVRGFVSESSGLRFEFE